MNHCVNQTVRAQSACKTITYRMNATKSERRGEHAHVFPIEFFLLLTLDKHSGQAVGDAFPCVHPFLDVRKHTAVNLQEIAVKLLSASVRLSGNPL